MAVVSPEGDQVILPPRTFPQPRPVSRHGISPECMLLLHAAEPVISAVFQDDSAADETPLGTGLPGCTFV